ncbi:MAG: AEC family transporter [Candidatus Competibacterales bacterium]
MIPDLLSQLLAVIAPVALTAAIGAAWARAGLPFNLREFTPLILYIGTPCLILSSLLRVDVPPATLATIALAAAGVVALNATVGVAVLKLARLPINTFLPSLIFPNTGNMGLPLCLFAFGPEGLALAVPFMATTIIGQFLLGQPIAAGRFDLQGLVRSPIVAAVVIAILALAFDITPPLWIDNTVSLLGQFTLPLMLLALGASLAQLGVATWGRSIWLAALRIGGGLTAGVFVALALGLEGPALGVVLIQASMPVAVYNYLFAQLYGNRPEEVASLVVVSTLLSFLVLPGLLTWLLTQGP